MLIIEKKRDLIKDLGKAMFNSRLKDNAKKAVNKHIEEQKEESNRVESSSILANVKKIAKCKNTIKGLQSKHEELEKKRLFIETSYQKQ